MIHGKSTVCPVVYMHLASLRHCFSSSGDIISRSPGSLEPQHLKMLLSLLQGSPNPSDRAQILITLGNTAAFTVNQVRQAYLKLVCCLNSNYCEKVSNDNFPIHMFGFLVVSLLFRGRSVFSCYIQLV